ncbi:hypothetical protein TTHERM_00312160 (macronuclear) [Tetrahymena thermophila SB210]|uniref:Uncharacterized protein n=1 Tax=Tetrahymena thermophila (strain SB210) TaxID=312017 RepID=Q22KR4_TETTS|nr:hypothetical protein TTHERM_00312160 [Tetrahymena thermophila SB210]EAR85735.1 hypothetical protein TTHERM_00312160 [Tetrahymena thermophila SB210]|eukprot:XP_001033398.1 hypothetical protein TTHERM_00312160 [Tetrahymena thermophila SB210]
MSQENYDDDVSKILSVQKNENEGVAAVDASNKLQSSESKNDDYEILCNPQELIQLQKECQIVSEKLEQAQKCILEKETINFEQEKRIKQLTEENSLLQEQVKEQQKKFEDEKSNLDIKNAQITGLENEIKMLKSELNDAKQIIEQSQKKCAQQTEKAHHYEEELNKLKQLIDATNFQIQEQNKLNQSLIRRNNDIVSQQQKKEEELKKKDQNKLMFSRIESVNNIFEQVETLKSELLTYEELFKNLDFPIFWDILSSRVNEKVDKHNGNKTEFRQSQLKYETKQICEGLQQALKVHNVNYKFEI